MPDAQNLSTEAALRDLLAQTQNIDANVQLGQDELSDIRAYSLSRMAEMQLAFTGQLNAAVDEILAALPPQGPQGVQGTQGFQGDPGLTGTRGAVGPTGAAGTNGTQGDRGYQGYQGYPGNQGNQGYQGVPGSSGSGNQGYQGYQGYQGPKGDTGAAGSSASVLPTVTANTSVAGYGYPAGYTGGSVNAEAEIATLTFNGRGKNAIVFAYFQNEDVSSKTNVLRMRLVRTDNGAQIAGNAFSYTESADTSGVVQDCSCSGMDTTPNGSVTYSLRVWALNLDSSAPAPQHLKGVNGQANNIVINVIEFGN